MIIYIYKKESKFISNFELLLIKWTYTGKWNMLHMWFYKQLFNFIENFNLFFTSFNWATEQHIACSLRYSSSLYHLSHYTLGQKHFNSSIPFIQSPNLNESAPQKLNTPLCSQLDNKTGYIFLKFLRSQSQHCPFDTEHSPLYWSCIFFSSAKNPEHEQFTVYTMSINFTLD